MYWLFKFGVQANCLQKYFVKLVVHVDCLLESSCVNKPKVIPDNFVILASKPTFQRTKKPITKHFLTV